MNVSTTNSGKRPFWFLSIVLSIASIVPTFAVLMAGSPDYGPLSEAWRQVPIPVLLAIAFGLLCLAARGLGRGCRMLGLREYVVPVLSLSVAAVPFSFVALAVALKAGGVGG